MNLEEQEKLAKKLVRKGYAKLVNPYYNLTKNKYNKNDVVAVSVFYHSGEGVGLGHNEDCYSIALPDNAVHPVDQFAVPTKKDFLMHSLK